MIYQKKQNKNRSGQGLSPVLFLCPGVTSAALAGAGLVRVRGFSWCDLVQLCRGPDIWIIGNVFKKVFFRGFQGLVRRGINTNINRTSPEKSIVCVAGVAVSGVVLKCFIALYVAFVGGGKMAISAVNIKPNISDSDGVMIAIDDALEMFCASAGIEDKKKIRPQEWTAALQYINAHAIKPAGVVRITEPGFPYKRLNYFAINALMDRYIYLCNLYSQAITIKGFSSLSGVSHESIDNWKHDKTRFYMLTDRNYNSIDYKTACEGVVDGDTVTIQPIDLYKKLLSNIEQNVNDMILDSGRRGIGAVVRYNRFYETHTGQGLQDSPPVFDITSTAQQLGILDHVQALPGVSGDKIAQRKE